jgi:hypothetical protein
MAQVQSVTTVTYPAAADLSTHQFKLAQVNSTGQAALIASQGVRVDGVIANKPTAAGQPCELQVAGLVKAIAGAAITPGAEVMSNASASPSPPRRPTTSSASTREALRARPTTSISILVDKYKI